MSYGKEQMDKYLNNKETVDLLNYYGLKLPSEYKDKSLEEFQEAFDKGLNEAASYKKSIKDVAKYKKDSKGRFTRYNFVACDKLTTSLQHESFRLNQTYNLLTIVAYDTKNVEGF